MDGTDPPNNPSTDPLEDPVVAGLVEAYANGVFPMADPGGAVYWYDPDPRGIIPLEGEENEEGGLRVSRSMRATLRAVETEGRFRVTSDRAFGDVIRACAGPRRGQTGDESWIDARIIDAYERLHTAGFAHSVEAWVESPGNEPVLVGGLYGVHLRGLFAGESMFSRPDLGGTDASKVCLVALWRHLRAQGCTLLDTQFMTDHLRSLGGLEISRAAYHERLATALAIDAAWGDVESR